MAKPAPNSKNLAARMLGQVARVAVMLVGTVSVALATGLVYERASEGWWLLAIGIACFLVSALFWRNDPLEAMRADGGKTTG